MNVEIFGTAASIMIILSLVSSNIKCLRLLNLIGSIMFVVYAIIINSFSIALTNVFGALFNIYHLIKIYKEGAI